MDPSLTWKGLELTGNDDKYDVTEEEEGYPLRRYDVTEGKLAESQPTV